VYASRSLIPVTVLEGADAGVCLWRQRGQLFATIAVKATFELAPSKVMVPRAPLPIEPIERLATPGTGVEAPGDLAPCLVQPEIWVRGHARRPPPTGATSLRVRLAVARDALLLVSKIADIAVEVGPFEPPFLHAFAPLSRSWPVRTRQLGGIDPADLDRSPMEIPGVFDWTFFQAAPPDQRLGPLRGNEWIRLEGFSAETPRLDTRLPSATAAASLFGSTDVLRMGLPLRIGLDSIQIDADRGTCALVFRGYVPLPPGHALEELWFVAGVGLPGRPLPRFDTLTTARARPTSSLPPPPSSERRVASTTNLDPAMVQSALSRGALPFQVKRPSSMPPPSSHRPATGLDEFNVAETHMLSEDLLARISSPALPFSGGAPAPLRPELADLPPILPFHPPEAPAGEPSTLGAHFLAAMAEHLHVTGAEVNRPG